MSSELAGGHLKTDRKKNSSYHLSRKSMREKSHQRNHSFKDNNFELGYKSLGYNKMSTGNLNLKLK